MDSVVNAVSYNCELAIIPDITLQTMDEKTVIVMEVPQGRQRPYFIRPLGLENVWLGPLALQMNTWSDS